MQLLFKASYTKGMIEPDCKHFMYLSQLLRFMENAENASILFGTANPVYLYWYQQFWIKSKKSLRELLFDNRETDTRLLMGMIRHVYDALMTVRCSGPHVALLRVERVACLKQYMKKTWKVSEEAFEAVLHSYYILPDVAAPIVDLQPQNLFPVSPITQATLGSEFNPLDPNEDEDDNVTL